MSNGSQPVNKQLRRSKGEGSIERRPGGKFRAVITVNNQKLVGPVVAKKTDAQPALREKLLRASIEVEPGGAAPLHEALEDLIDRLEQEPATMAINRRTLGLVKGKDIASMPVIEISNEDLELWRKQLPGSPATRNRYVSALQGMIRKLGGTAKLTPLRVEETEFRILTKPEQRRLLALSLPDRVRTIVLLGLRCGLRRSEMAGLTHEDRDDDGIVIHRQAIEVGGKVYVKRPKTIRSTNWVPLPPELAWIGTGKGYVLATATGEPMRGPNIYRDLQKALEGTEFESMGPHDLRHTYGMTLLESGVDIVTAAEMMRCSPAVLAKDYARSRRDLKRKAIRKALKGIA